MPENNAQLKIIQRCTFNWKSKKIGEYEFRFSRNSIDRRGREKCDLLAPETR